MDNLIKKNPFVAMILANLFLGLNSLWGKIGLETIPTFLYSGIRYSLGGLILLAFGYFAGQSLKKADPKHVVLQSLLQITMGLSWFYALTLTQAINSSIIFLLTPIIVYVGSVVFLKEPRSTRAMLGSLVAFVGGILMFGAPAVGSGSTDELIGNGLLIVSAASLAVLILHSKLVIRDDNLHALLGVRWLASGMMGLLLAIFLEDVSSVSQISAASFAALLMGTVVSGAFGMIVFYKSLEHMQAEDSASLFYIDPLIGTIGAGVILGESLSTASLIAAGVILMGVVIAHPIHINRMIYYQKIKHSRFEEFVRWARKEYDTATHILKKYF